MKWIVPLGVVAVVVVSSIGAGQRPAARWRIDPAPLLVLGKSDADMNDMFTEVVGATRLPDGRVMVGDRGDFALWLFSSDGKLVRRFGQKGGGPGEIRYLKTLLRCGDSVITLDIDGNRSSVFSLGGDYGRVFKFASPQAARSSYRSACNSRGDFAHYGWEDRLDMKAGTYRPMVPLWLSKADAAPAKAIATVHGSERHGFFSNGQNRGSGPLPLGKQTAIALGRDRVYLATGDRYEIAVYDFNGKQLETVREARVAQATTQADIDYAKEREIGAGNEARRASVERFYATVALPKTLPTYSTLQIDSSGNVWAQDYPRATATTTTWTVFGVAGQRVASVSLPMHLELYEIGNDYILGRFIDPDELIPQVRLYRLRRSS